MGHTGSEEFTSGEMPENLKAGNENEDRAPRYTPYGEAGLRHEGGYEFRLEKDTAHRNTGLEGVPVVKVSLAVNALNLESTICELMSGRLQWWRNSTYRRRGR